MQNPSWSDVRVFLEVHRAGTLSGAARTLGVYASTVGRRLEALESQLGTVLFQRTPDGLIATGAAEGMLEAAQIMERQAQLITHRISGESSALRGPVRLSTTPDMATHFLIERLVPFRERHPDIELTLLTSTTFADLGRGEADLALRFTRDQISPVPREHEDLLIAYRLAAIGVCLYASKDYLDHRGRPSSAQDLSGHDLAMPSAAWIPGYAWMVEHGANARCTLRIDTIAGLTVAAMNGFGITPLPAFMAISYPELERIGPSQVAENNSWIIMPRDLRRVARVRAVREILIEVFDTWRTHLIGGPDDDCG